MPVNLTKRAIDALPVTTNPHGERHFDNKLPGFGVVCYPNGRKVFFLQFGPSTRRRKMKLGTYGVDLTPEQARAKAQAFLHDISEGADPLDERQIERDVPTFEEWADAYLTQVRLRKKHPRHDERFLACAKKAWGMRKIDTLTAGDVSALFQAIAQEGHKISANRFLASIRACFQAAWRLGKVASNEAMKVKPFPENEPRERTLSEEERDRFYAAVDRLQDEHVRAAFYLLLQTGARLSEVLNAKWRDVDLDGATWRIPSTKSGKPQVLPLPPGIVTMLTKITRKSEFVIAGKLPNKPRSDLKKPWAHIQEDAGIENVSIHDLRRTFGLCVAKTAGLHMASRLLRHSDVRVTERHYAPLGIADMREAMNNVVPLRHKVSGDD